jgi:DNA-binding NarL/FixJ family response regulator
MLLTLVRPHLNAVHQARLRQRSQSSLTDRQLDLLRKVAAGLDNRQIARHLAISEATVRTHLQNIYSRLDVSSRTAAIATVFPPRADW